MQKEINQLREEINRIGSATKFNGIALRERVLGICQSVGLEIDPDKKIYDMSVPPIEIDPESGW